MRVLTAIPVYNEVTHVRDVLAATRRYCSDILVVNDGCTDGTPALLDRVPDVLRIDHPRNRGYGAALISAFGFAVAREYDVLVTMDCDGQHEPARIPVLLEAIHDCDIVSGSRYLRDFRQDTPAPSDRRFINAAITREIDARYGLTLTDSFCGFKAYRRAAIERLSITEQGWGMPLQLWVQAARQKLRVKEIAVPRLYLDPNRAFGGMMNDPEQRLAYYRSILVSAEHDVLPARLVAVLLRAPCIVVNLKKGTRINGGPRAVSRAWPAWRAPVPPLDAIPRPIEDNRRKLDDAPTLVDGQPLRRFRAEARREALAACEKSDGDASSPFDVDGPLLLTGHQPELAHPGVWLKNFVLHGLAGRIRGVPLNLIVDNDTLKTTSLRLPVFRKGEPKSVRVQSLAFDEFSGEVAYEDYPIRNPEIFRSFPARVAEITRNWGYEPLLPRVWRENRTIDRAFVAMRRECERAWGCRNRELRVSRLSQTAAFARFARHILGDLPRFREVYNAAIQSYRRENGIRSQSHPAPDLAPDEAPFWVQTAGVRKRATSASDPGSLRPRALTLTLFARLCLGDFFIHGIGGGKYDEVTDRIIRDYFDIEPPAYQVLSATLLLPLPVLPATAEDLQGANRQLRDLQWNPQRHILSEPAADPEARRLIALKESLIRSEPPKHDHSSRRRWFHDLQEATGQLRPCISQLVSRAEADMQRVQAEAHANAILNRRDYSWVFHPEETLKAFLHGFL